MKNYLKYIQIWGARYTSEYTVSATFRLVPECLEINLAKIIPDQIINMNWNW